MNNKLDQSYHSEGAMTPQGMIAGYAQLGLHKEALKIFGLMVQSK